MGQGFAIREGSGMEDADACVTLQREVWGLSDLEITPTIQLIATLHAGGLVHIAETPDGKAIGFAYAFPALRGGAAHLHSDMLAVLPEHRKRGVGIGLKRAQRDSALARNIELITWTFDPLQAKNAHLNLRRLGAAAVEFVPNLYGVTSSPLHHALPTHRLLIHWVLRSPRAVERAQQDPRSRTEPAPDLPHLNRVKWEAGWPVTSEPTLDIEASKLLLEVPPDFNTLAGSAPTVAGGWHEKVSRALETYLGRGYRVVDLIPAEENGRRRPLYLLERIEP